MSLIVAERVVELDAVAEYEPGRFYLRELPALQAVPQLRNDALPSHREFFGSAFSREIRLSARRCTSSL